MKNRMNFWEWMDRSELTGFVLVLGIIVLIGMTIVGLFTDGKCFK